MALRPERFARWTAAYTLRTARVARAQRALLARHESGCALVYPPGKSIRAPWRPAISFCSYNLPADRASYRRRYVAFPQSSRGVATRAVRRNIPRACRRAEDQQRRPHFDRESTRRNRSPRTRQPPYPATASQRENRAPNRDAVSFRFGRTSKGWGYERFSSHFG